MNSRGIVFFAQAAIAAVLIVSTAAEAAVVRCTAPDGRVTYQDSGCPRGSRSEPVDETANKGFTFAARKEIERLRRERDRERAEERKREKDRTRIIPGSQRSAKVKDLPINPGERRFITVGMDASDVRARIGKPDQVVRPSSGTSKPGSKGSLQRWIYHPADDDPQTTTVVSVRSGIVTAVDRRVTR